LFLGQKRDKLGAPDTSQKRDTGAAVLGVSLVDLPNNWLTQ
jgi:hypothetical protein